MTSVSSTEGNPYPELLISRAVLRKKFETNHVEPFVEVDGKLVHVPETLKDLLHHPFPRNQGPLRLPLDSNNIVTECKEKTLFSHSDSQPCAAWVPVMKGIHAWDGDQGQVTYKVSGLSRVGIKGAATTKMKSLLYTCNLFGCVIECPCNVCTDIQNLPCRLVHHMGLCSQCTPQCREHQIKVSYMFDATTDLYTIVTDELDKYRYAYGYAGCPRSCKDCAEDVMQHQIYHLVYHPLCRFCLFEFRSLELLLKSDRIKLDFKNAEIIINWRDRKTCSTCLIECKDKTARVKHEATVHNHAVQFFKCDLCPKSYSSKNAMSYHVGQKHSQPVQKFPCDLCDSQFTTLASLKRHKSMKHKSDDHQAATEFTCEDCSEKFLLLSSLKRHQREQHFAIKFNLDFHEGYDPPQNFECVQCDKKFKRKDHLKSHIRSKHNENVFQCYQCDKSYGRQEALNRHIRSDHVVEGYNCDHCDQKFSRQDVLSRHIESVHYLKTYKCVQCEKDFGRNDELTRHVKSVHSLKSYLCVKCDLSFGRKDNLLRHVKSKHK